MDCASDEKRCKIQLVKAVAQRHDYRPAIGAATTTLDATIKAYGINERVHPGMSAFGEHVRLSASQPVTSRTARASCSRINHNFIKEKP
jgi:hypothetical protein